MWKVVALQVKLPSSKPQTALFLVEDGVHLILEGDTEVQGFSLDGSVENGYS